MLSVRYENRDSVHKNATQSYIDQFDLLQRFNKLYNYTWLMERYNKGYGKFPNFNKINMGAERCFHVSFSCLSMEMKGTFLLKTEISQFVLL